MTYMLWVWVGVIGLALIVEALSLDMTSIWFSVGGLCALILHAFGASLTAQIIVFVVVTALSIIFLRRLTKKLIQKPTVATNIDKNIGSQTKLLEPISQDTLGSIRINGIIYSAKSQDGTDIASGCEVEVVDIEGNKFIVKEVQTENKGEDNQKIATTNEDEVLNNNETNKTSESNN